MKIRWISTVLLLAILAFGGGYWYASRRPLLTPQPTPVPTKPSVVVYVPISEGNTYHWLPTCQLGGRAASASP